MSPKSKEHDMTSIPTNAAQLNTDLNRQAAIGNRQSSAWHRWWFTPESPLNLAICRVLFFALEFLYHLPIRFDAWGDVPKALFRPVWIFEKLHLPILPTTGLLILEIVWKAAMCFACIGLFTRVA